MDQDLIDTQPEVEAGRAGLDVGERYTSYVDWPGDRIVTIVVATKPGHVEPTGWRFPIVGRVPYKGFFDVEKADAEAEHQRSRGNDVCQVPVPAYSTLGWFDDPITAPMLRGGDEQTVETVLHELGYRTFVEEGFFLGGARMTGANQLERAVLDQDIGDDLREKEEILVSPAVPGKQDISVGGRIPYRVGRVCSL